MEKSSYKLLDFCLFGIVTSCVLVGLVSLMEQRYSQFFEQDPAVSFYIKETEIVPTWMLLAICIPVSSGFVFIHTFLSLKDINRIVKLVECLCMGFNLFVGTLASHIATTVLKVSVGRPRPIALYGCDYLGYRYAVDSNNFTTYNSLSTFGKVGSVDNCHDTKYVEDMWSSFPSGHASFSFATMVFTYLICTKILKIEKDVYFGWQNLLAFIPIVVAAFISATRIMDYKHHVDDVIAGAIIGTVCAYFAWKNYETLVKVAMKAVGEEVSGGREESVVELTPGSSGANSSGRSKRLDV